MKLLKNILLASMILASPTIFANVIWSTDELDVNITNQTKSTCQVENIINHHGIMTLAPEKSFVVGDTIRIKLLEYYLGNAIDIDLICGNKRISLSSHQSEGVVFPGTVQAEVLSAHNGINATHTEETHYGVLGATSTLNWTITSSD